MPTKQTLQKYGLTQEDFDALVEKQGGKCPICGKVPKRFVIDHEHTQKWKQLHPEERRKYVRGLLCWTCNYYLLAKGVTRSKLQAAIEYLDRYKNSK